MTRLFNLESYVDCCQYAYLFGASPEKLQPSSPNALPNNYKDFLLKHQDRAWMPLPVLPQEQTGILAPNPYPLELQTPGLLLTGDQIDHLLVIRDVNVMQLRSLNLPPRSQYLYASAYRYWNYASQLQPSNSHQASKPLVIYDLDSFNPPHILPLVFDSTQASAPYPVPVLNHRAIEEYDQLKLPFKSPDIYNQLCQRLASGIVIDLEQLAQVTAYLQQIKIFDLLQDKLANNPDLKELSILIKIGPEIYRPHSFEIFHIDQIISETLPLKELQQFARNYLEYRLALLSVYNCFPCVKEALSSNFILVDTNCTEFNRIWEDKQANNFPLYGQYLDQITFEGKDFQVDVPDPNSQEAKGIFYEGEKHPHLFRGVLKRKSGETKSTFKMNEIRIYLPIKVNGQPLLRDGKEQVYILTNQFAEEEIELSVEVRFYLKPGTEPKLEVVEVIGDQFGRKIQSEQGDPPESLNQSSAYIPFQEILRYRNQKLSDALERLQNNVDLLEKFSSAFDGFMSSLNEYLNFKSSKTRRIGNIEFNQIRKVINKDTFRFVGIEVDFVPRLATLINNDFRKLRIKDVMSSLYQDLMLKTNESNDKAYRKRTESPRNLYNDLIITIGWLYGVSSLIPLDFMFEDSYLNNRTSKNEYIKVLARISQSEFRQRKYLQLFPMYYTDQNYIWGYARILKWYLHFSYASQWQDFNFHDHFSRILNYIQSAPKNSQEYNRDALIALIHLLSFREFNPEFCKSGSESYRLGKAFCDRLRYDPIRSKQMQSDKPLNELFEELLEGQASSEQMMALLEVE